MEKILEEITPEGEAFIIYRLKGLADNITYLLAQNGVCISIDPGKDQVVDELISELGLKLEAILITHFHKEHSGGAKELKGEKRIPILGPKHRELSFLDQVIEDGDEISLGPFSMTVIHAPGHTILGGCGNMEEGNEHHYFHSLEKIKSLPIETRIFAGHAYNTRSKKAAPFHTLEKEMVGNPFLKALTPHALNELFKKCKECN